ncbi:leucyl aminopeptidase [Modestobacter sp. I12A-02628]|uniref:Probable cytosol aminopeptidase n=1 Tax=Goekera deserti TaxID=2497753 RepID=A0A7K3WB09_9ACTN|nr:leucyl aminopeptidase [Goekera deserti]MPQ97636.1 leucyl aminopeptidase [Goekera deserti]NDI47759.1 leucyl aminopeptidase [Goekera deserti]NEL53507.1 leucyl aminopeptidase [Goekera deserti]
MPPTITATDRPLEKLTADAVVLGVGKGPAGLLPTPGSEAVDRLLGGRLMAALADLGATGAEGEVTKLPTFGQTSFPVVAVAGLGAPGPTGGYEPEAVRRAAGAASRALTGRASLVTLLAAVGGAPEDERLHAVAEGSLLGTYEFTAYKSGLADDRPLPPSSIAVVVPRASDATAALARSRAVAAAVTLVRDLVNTPPNDLYPAELAARGAAAGKKAGLSVEVLDEKALAAGGYGGILAVGQGSSRGPRLLRLTYKGKKAGTSVALVGKGITFDTGGISIKPAAKMEDMKSDMAGAAAVIATVCLVAELGLPVDVTATVPIAENMPSGTAYRPADVVTFRNGKKAEITNTDAEGRVVLADAIVRAAEDSPDYLLETSTLTGAQLVALGTRTAGVMGSEDLRDAVVAASRRSGEPMWAMPLPPELRRGLDSPVADLVNANADRMGGMLVGGHFLSEFVPAGLPWAHIDVAGPAYNTGAAWGYTPKGGTGVPVRTLLATIEALIATAR